MALTELELTRCERAIARFMEQRRPPTHIRSEVDLGYKIEGQSVELFEVRPDWRDKTIRRETPVAKATYIRTKDRWRVFWMRRDLKWHGYEPNYEVRAIDDFLVVVAKDEYGCFFG